jgi:hypothetical protein
MNSIFKTLRKQFYSTKPWSYLEATAWQKAFNQQDIPKEHVSISFSRSSGPGGQNVNKGLSVLLRKCINQKPLIQMHS